MRSLVASASYKTLPPRTPSVSRVGATQKQYLGAVTTGSSAVARTPVVDLAPALADGDGSAPAPLVDGFGDQDTAAVDLDNGAVPAAAGDADDLGAAAAAAAAGAAAPAVAGLAGRGASLSTCLRWKPSAYPGPTSSCRAKSRCTVRCKAASGLSAAVPAAVVAPPPRVTASTPAHCSARLLSASLSATMMCCVMVSRRSSFMWARAFMRAMRPVSPASPAYPVPPTRAVPPDPYLLLKAAAFLAFAASSSVSSDSEGASSTGAGAARRYRLGSDDEEAEVAGMPE